MWIHIIEAWKMAASLNEVFDVLIIGCGAVGAAVAREMTLLGQKCIVLEKNMDVLSEASSGNTGHLVRVFFYMSFLWVTNGILLPKLFWPTVRKKYSSDREKLLKFEAEGWEFAKILRSSEQFIQTVKGQKKIS